MVAQCVADWRCNKGLTEWQKYNKRSNVAIRPAVTALAKSSFLHASACRLSNYYSILFYDANLALYRATAHCVQFSRLHSGCAPNYDENNANANWLFGCNVLAFHYKIVAPCHKPTHYLILLQHIADTYNILQYVLGFCLYGINSENSDLQMSCMLCIINNKAEQKTLVF